MSLKCLRALENPVSFTSLKSPSQNLIYHTNLHSVCKKKEKIYVHTHTHIDDR